MGGVCVRASVRSRRLGSLSPSSAPRSGAVSVTVESAPLGGDSHFSTAPTGRLPADPGVTAALAAYQAGRGSEQAALTALAAARLLVPVVAVLAGGSDAGKDKNSEKKRSLHSVIFHGFFCTQHFMIPSPSCQ